VTFVKKGFEYRCTRPEAYAGDCEGRTSVAARQGHYFFAQSQLHAALKMKAIVPGETLFDVQTVRDPEGRKLPKEQHSLTRYTIKATEGPATPLRIPWEYTG
jgi:hypothetical protein